MLAPALAASIMASILVILAYYFGARTGKFRFRCSYATRETWKHLAVWKHLVATKTHITHKK